MTDKEHEAQKAAASGEADQDKFETALRQWQNVTAPLTEATRKAERLTEKDFAIRINTRT